MEINRKFSFAFTNDTVSLNGMDYDANHSGVDTTQENPTQTWINWLFCCGCCCNRIVYHQVSTVEDAESFDMSTLEGLSSGISSRGLQGLNSNGFAPQTHKNPTSQANATRVCAEYRLANW